MARSKGKRLDYCDKAINIEKRVATDMGTRLREQREALKCPGLGVD